MELEDLERAREERDAVFAMMGVVNLATAKKRWDELIHYAERVDRETSYLVFKWFDGSFMESHGEAFTVSAEYEGKLIVANADASALMRILVPRK